MRKGLDRKEAFMIEWLEFISQTIIGEIILIVLGVLIARPIQDWIITKRHLP